MSRRPLPARALALAAVSSLAVAQPPSLDEILTRHEEALGGPAARRASLAVQAHLHAGSKRFAVRWLVQREPFAYRQELAPVEPPGPPLVQASDGRHAWRPLAGRPGEPLTGEQAIACLESAFLDGLLYLDRERCAGRAIEPAVLAPLPEGPEGEVPVHRAEFRTPAGTGLRLAFEARDGRLLEAAEPWVSGRWLRYFRWQRFGALTLPTRYVAGSTRQAGTAVLEIHDVRIDPPRDESLLAGHPLAARPAVQRAGKLALLWHTLPGAAELVLEEVRVQRGGPRVGALLDTTADRTAIAPALAERLRLSACGDVAPSEAEAMRFVDGIAHGEHVALQVVASCRALPGIALLPADRQPLLRLGGEELQGSAPVLDLANGELWLRPRGGTPLDFVPGGERRRDALPVAVRRHGPGFLVAVHLGSVELSAALDTSQPAALLLTPAALARCGLPATRAEWLARGAVPVVASGGAAREELLVRLESFRVGPIVWQRPWVRLCLDAEDATAEARFGVGAFLPFARVGLDPARAVLELEPKEIVLGESGFAVAVPGELLGLVLRAGSGEAGVLPVVSAVLPGTRAAMAGVKVEDTLLAVDGVATAGVPVHEWNRKLWLAEGGSVALELRAPGEASRTVRLP